METNFISYNTKKNFFIPKKLFYDYNLMIQKKKFLNKIKKFLIKKDSTYAYR
jgi:hypothetical protein